MLDGICPVSHIPISELRMAVVFRNSAVVFDAEHIVCWLRHSLRNPMTNEILRSDFATNLLVPVQLPHMSLQDVERTARFLRLQGRIRVVVSFHQTGHTVLGFTMLAMTWLFNLYWFAVVIGCLERDDEFPCLWTPFLYYSVQLVACVCALCMFPQAGFWGAFREVVQFFLFILALLLGFWMIFSCRIWRVFSFDRTFLMLHCAASP